MEMALILRRMTEKALDRQKLQEEEKRKKQSEKEKALQKVNERIAAKIIEGVYEKCKQEAYDCEYNAVIMKLVSNRDCSGPVSKYSPEKFLKGPALIVYNYLKEKKLNPSVESLLDCDYNTYYVLKANW
jgi:hypothetical protein